jgi:DNA-binding PadR family transcriptional regulator
MRNDLSKSSLSLAILGLVSLGPLSGYDLRKIFTTTPMGHFSTSPGAIYPALRRLERRGLIKGEVKKRDTLRPRQTFEITVEGLRALKEILLKPVAVGDVKWNLDSLVLRFAFMGKILGKRKSIRFLEELVTQTDAHIGALEEHLETNRGGMPATAVYALEHGIATYHATVRWAHNVIKELNPG